LFIWGIGWFFGVNKKKQLFSFLSSNSGVLEKFIYICPMKRKLSKKDVSGESPFAKQYEFIFMDKERGAIKIDVAASCRFYVNDVLNDDRNSLSLRSKEMLLWIMGRLRSGDDIVVINRGRYMEELGITSLPTVRKAIKGLIDTGIIAKTNIRGVYYINAIYFFRGSRIRKWPECSRPYAYVNDKTGSYDDSSVDKHLPF